MSNSDINFYTSFFSRGNRLFVRCAKNGITSNMELPISPSLYLPSPAGKTADGYTLDNEPLSRVSFDSPKDAKTFVKEYPSTVYGYNRFDYARIHEAFPGKIIYDMDQINTAFIDIETGVEFGGFPDITNPRDEILLITFIVRKKIFTLSTRPVKVNKTNSKILLFKSEEDLLNAFREMLHRFTIHNITGWNVKYFDVPYIINRMMKVCGSSATKRLSPFGDVGVVDQFNQGRLQHEGLIYGITILDYLELYQKFELSPRESYKLDYIGEVEVGQNKLPYDGTFREFYSGTYEPVDEPAEDAPELTKACWKRVKLRRSLGTEHPDYQAFDAEVKQLAWDTFVEYNIIDTILVQRIDAKLRFIDVAINMAFKSKCNFDDVYRVTRIWDNIIFMYLVDQNIHPEFNPSFSGSGYEGAFVKPTIPGKYEWLASFDVESLYPSLIIQYNISPDTMLAPRHFLPIRPADVNQKTELYQQAIAQAKDMNATLCANGAMFSKDKEGFMPALTKIYFSDRVSAKNEMKDWKKKLQLAKKELERRKGGST